MRYFFLLLGIIRDLFIKILEPFPYSPDFDKLVVIRFFFLSRRSYMSQHRPYVTLHHMWSNVIQRPYLKIKGFFCFSDKKTRFLLVCQRRKKIAAPLRKMWQRQTYSNTSFSMDTIDICMVFIWQCTISLWFFTGNVPCVY